MNVAKNWALTIMFSSFSIRSFLERTVVERATLVISTQNWSILAKFPPQNPAKSAVFYWLFHGEVSPLKFPVKSADFSKNLPLKILRNLTFFRNNPAKSADFSVNLPLKIREILLFFPWNIRSPVKSNNEAYKHRLKLIWTFEIKNNYWYFPIEIQKNMF